MKDLVQQSRSKLIVLEIKPEITKWNVTPLLGDFGLWLDV